MDIRIYKEQKISSEVFYAEVTLAAIDDRTGELIKRLDLSAESIDDQTLTDAYMPFFLDVLEANGYLLDDIINFEEVVNIDMQVISDELTAKLQEQTGLTTNNTVDLIAELIEQIKETPTKNNIKLYAEIMSQN